MREIRRRTLAYPFHSEGKGEWHVEHLHRR